MTTELKWSHQKIFHTKEGSNGGNEEQKRHDKEKQSKMSSPAYRKLHLISIDKTN